MRILCAAICAAFLSSCASAQAPRVNEAASSVAFEAVKRGGYVLVMRHANSPDDQLGAVGLSTGCTLAPGRGLDAEGFFQARAMGEILKENGVPILKAYTSPMCRSWDTAGLAAGGARVVPHPSQVSTKAADVAAMKTRVAAELARNPRNQHYPFQPFQHRAALWRNDAQGREKEVPSGVIWLVHPQRTGGDRAG